MKQLLTAILVLTSYFSFGQHFSYPVVSKYGQTMSDLIPNGWSLLDSATGDLNNDKLDDIALVFQYQDSVSHVKAGDGYLDTVITQPRILVLFFYNSRIKQYELVKQSNSFILNHDDPNMEEPFDGISISKGVLKIDFHIFMNAGGWGTNNNTYRFRYQQGQFWLIGADYSYTNRSSGETEDRSYNFLTKKVKLSTGNISEEHVKTKWRNFHLPALKTFNTFHEPFTWEVEKDFYL